MQLLKDEINYLGTSFQNKWSWEDLYFVIYFTKTSDRSIIIGYYLNRYYHLKF